ncbi:MAG: AAA family ATPase, partial [Eubacterium sp.]|nr:AAA family ATPase [Eubacterium sp.]
IIDEVHMLSKGAFNALLKTLEEPPEHVIFILATTEVHMLPATILSRCQRFDFKRIQPETMALRLKEVAGFENMQLDDDAAILISRIADGGMRDALSILDQCAGRGQHIDSKLVSEVAGIAGREALYELSDAICNQNSGDALNIISNLHQNSYDMERLCVEMINHFRNFLIVKTVKKSRELIICTDDEYDTITKSAEHFTLAKVIFALDLFQNTLTIIKGGANARIEMEMSFVKLCQPKLETSMEAVLDRIATLERAVKNGVNIANVQPVKTVVNAEPPKAEPIPQAEESVSSVQEPVVQQEEKIEKQASFDIEKPAVSDLPEPEMEQDLPPWETPQPQVVPQAVPQSEAPAPSAPQEVVQTEFAEWAEFMEVIYKSDIAIYGVLNDAMGYVRDEYFLINSSNPMLRQFIKMPTHSKAIKQALFDVTGKRYKLGIFKTSEENKEKKDPLEDLISKVQGNMNVNIE